MDLTGNHLVEDNFLENYLLPEQFPYLPEGMIPMCYPSDHPDGVYIANWALWFILELYEYQGRSPQSSLIPALKNRVDGILAFMARYENEDGLLENIPGWVFVEWSKANELTDGVNYPSNMLYSATLLAASRLYKKEEYRQKVYGSAVKSGSSPLTANGSVIMRCVQTAGWSDSLMQRRSVNIMRSFRDSRTRRLPGSF